MIAPIGGIGSLLSSTQLAGASPSAHGASLSLGEPASATSGPTLSADEPATGGVGNIQGTNGSEGSTGVEGTAGSEATAGGESGGSFGDALTNAISSLDQSQQSAGSAAQALATGSLSNPESAVVTVEEAQLSMQLASQIRSKATEAVQQIFQTQV